MQYTAPVTYAAYEVQGTGVRIGWDATDVRDQLQTLCAYFGLVAVPSESTQCAITLTWHAHGDPGPLPSHARLVAQHHGLEAWQAGTQFYLSGDRGLVRLDPAAGLGLGTFSTVPSTPPTLHRDLFLYSLLWLLRAQGWYAAHAACLTTGDGGCLMIADSSSGKSTLALGLVQAGWHYLADDAILLRSYNNEDVEVRPLRRDLYLGPEAATLFPDTQGYWQPCLLREDTKQRLDMEALYHSQLRNTCFPDLLLFPTIVDAPKSRLIPIEKAEALYRLIQQSALPTIDPQMAPEHLDILARLVRQTRHVRLLAGQDLAHDPRRIAQILEEVQQPAPCA
ncbi:MAG: hypothetical protein OJF51_003150 [Nitrospira sp.]|nr:MAG: hypothetical protein OJF51_003150 [Nitrospira sp.]